MKKISGVVFWIAIILDIAVNIQQLIGWIAKMDKVIALELALAAIIIVSGLLFLREKYREFMESIVNRERSILKYYETSRQDISEALNMLQRQLPNLKLLLVDSAQYGAGEKYNDVSHVLRSKMSAGKIEQLPINNDTLGPDPIKGQRKILTVKYTYGGETKTATVKEGGFLTLP